jgi:uncharacterized protein
VTNRPVSIFDRLARRLVQRPFEDELGHKGWFARISRAPAHVVQRLTITIAGWPRFARSLRIVFLSDFHAGSHANDLQRLGGILAEAASYEPDLVLFGGDYVNMQIVGGGRLAPRVIAALLARLNGACGRFAVLGNHDYVYDEHEVAEALRKQDIVVLDHERQTLTFQQVHVDIVGVPDAHIVRSEARRLLAEPWPGQPTIILAHDPVWFAEVPKGPFLTLAGHTHGGQIKIPGIGVVTNASRAPRHWTHGLIVEDDRYLYVSAGLGTSGIPLRIGVPPEFAVLDVNGS